MPPPQARFDCLHPSPPAPQHTPRNPSHTSPARKRIPQPHHIPSKRVPNGTHQRKRPPNAPTPRPKANPRTGEPEGVEPRHLLQRRRQRCRPLRPEPIVCIHRRPPLSTHLAIRRPHRPPASVPQPHHTASKRVPNGTHQRKRPPSPRRLAQKRIRAPKRTIEVSCGIFSSAGASDAAHSGPM